MNIKKKTEQEFVDLINEFKKEIPAPEKSTTGLIITSYISIAIQAIAE